MVSVHCKIGENGNRVLPKYAYPVKSAFSTQRARVNCIGGRPIKGILHVGEGKFEAAILCYYL